MDKPFQVEIDPDEYDMGAILMWGGRLVCYHSKLVHGALVNYPTFDKEVYERVQSVKKWKHYLMGKETIIHIYH